MLGAIFREGPISMPEVAERTGLSKPTISQAVGSLRQAGLVREEGKRRGKRGPLAALYSVDSHVGFVAAVDLGGATIRVAIANIYGEIVSEVQQPTDPRGGEHAVGQIVEMARPLVGSLEGRWQRVLSVGVSAPGVVDPSSGRLILSYNIPRLNDMDVSGILGNELGVPVFLENNANLAAVGEKWRGLAKDHANFVLLTVGTGVGMGVVIGNELFRGSRGTAGEIAFLPLAENPFDPRHLRRGSLEDSAATAGVMAAAKEIMGAELVPTSVEEVFNMAAGGDVAAREVVEYEASLLALAVVSTTAIIDPELVLLGGGIGTNLLLLESVRGAAKKLLAWPPRIERSTLGDRASLYGALAMALRDGRARLFSRVDEPSKSVANRR